MESYLNIESVWEDESLFEVKVSASNGGFSGVAKCYTNRSEMSRLAEDVNGFPKKIGQEVSFTTGESDDLSYFTISFRCIDASGHVLVRVKIAHIVKYTNAETERYISEFDLNIEAAAIDSFVASVNSLAHSELGKVKAELRGKI